MLLFLFLVSSTLVFNPVMADKPKVTIKALKATVRGHKAYITRINGQIQELTTSPDTDNVAKLKALNKYLDNRLDILDEVVSELITHPDATEQLIDQTATYMANARMFVECTEADIVKLDVTRERAELESTRRHDDTVSSPSEGSSASKTKLPEVPFPTFWGGPTGSRDFKIFLRMFEELVGSDCSEAQRVTYFRTAIKGDAELLIKHIDPVPENYDLIFNTLFTHYKPKQGQARALWGELMSIQSWRKCNANADLLSLIQHVRQYVYLIKDLDPDAQTDHETLVDAIMVLLPEKLMYDISRGVPSTDRTVERILTETERFMTAREDVSSYYQGVPKLSSNGAVGRGNVPGRGHRDDRYKTSTHFSHAKGNSSRGTGAKSRPDSVVKPVASATTVPSCKPTMSVMLCVYCDTSLTSESDHDPHSCKDRPAVDECRVILKTARCCFNCLKRGHSVRDCRVPSKCACGRGKHSPSICFKSDWKGSVSSSRVADVALPVGSGPTFMETAMAIAEDPESGVRMDARVFVDRGSTDSYCTTYVTDSLGCSVGDQQIINIGTFAADKIKPMKSKLVRLNIISKVTNKSVPVQILSMDSLCGDLPSCILDREQSREVSRYALADPEATKRASLSVDILIGMDYLWAFMKQRVETTSFGPRLLDTEFGWVLSGPVCQVSRNAAVSAHFIRAYHIKCESAVMCDPEVKRVPVVKDEPVVESDSVVLREPVRDSDEELGRIMHKLWDLDILGVKDEEVSPVESHFEEHVEYCPDGRVQVRIPFKEEIKSYIPTSYHQASIRFNQLKRKLNKPGNESIKSKYEAVIAEQLASGVIEPVPVKDDSVFVNCRDEPRPSVIDPNTALIGTNDSSNQVKVYLPCHGVIKPGSDKLRVVNDASCEAYTGALTLNDGIHGGPAGLADLAETLMKFRLNNICIVGDITKAYLQIRLHPDDRDAFRFLWYDGDKDVEYRFARVPFGVIVSAFMLNAVLKFHLRKEFASRPELLELILSSLYVDDMVTGTPDIQSAIELKESLEVALGKISMELHGWNSNSAELRERWGAMSDDIVKVLGLLWNPVDDSVAINIERVVEASSCEPTKKNLLSLTASVWDPLGLVSPFLVKPKLMFQEICKSKIGWRGRLPEDLRLKWEEWKSQLPDLAQIRLPRQVTLPKYDRVELHCFADASESAYAACFYVKCVYGQEIRVNLVFAKNRIAPVAAHSLSRLELLGATMLARLSPKVISTHSNLKFDKVVYYSDSQNVLHWVKSDNRQWSTFVQNRVLEIHKFTKPKDWVYVRSERNPSDKGTRPMSAKDLVNSFQWFHGPTFLHDESIACGDKVDFQQPTAECLIERKKSVKVAVVEVPFTIIDITRHSSFEKVMRITSYVLKFIMMKFPRVYGGLKPSHTRLHNLSVNYWIKREQLSFYPKEVAQCPEGAYAGPSVAAVSSLARSLRLFKDQNGILRYESRVQDKFSSYDCCNPILLPKASHLTWLYVYHLHRIYLHPGIAELLFHVRKTFWIPQGRNFVRSIIARCVACRKVSAAPFPNIAPPPLPDFRVNQSEPFEFTGVDTAGPVYYRVGKSRVKRKGHILILTCATTRAFAFEFITGLSVEEVMLGLRRFFANHGLPREIRSDNAKSFKRTQKELNIVSKSIKMRKYLDEHRIKWVRYLERAPWWGGYIERGVQTAKRALHRIMGNAVLDALEYTTILYEIAALINSRPITTVYDGDGVAEPVSPSMLLRGRSMIHIPPLYETTVDGKEPHICRGRLRYLEKLKTYFWYRWVKEYLADLREIHARRKVGHKLRQPVVGELVLVRNEKLPRGAWKVGLVTELKPGRDGQVRSVRVRVVRGKKGKKLGKVKSIKKVILNRSPQHLVPLEGTNED